MSQVSNNKRVAKNTLFLYFRMILIMLVTLYTSRVILAELGISDFGIFNVVAGVVMMFAFLNNCMVTSTQRYLNFEMGKGNPESIRKVFSAALNIHIGIAIAIILLCESIGIWFLNHKLNIPADRMVAANWIFQFSILTFCVNILQVPYNAVIIAHEKMNVYAYISILEAFLKLGIVYLLAISPMDKLITYGILFFLVQLIIRLIYQVYCRRNYQEARFRLFWDKALYKEMTGFALWNMFGSLAWLLRDQGLNIVLNLFFGPVINAARGVAMQVSRAVQGFISNFQMALNPQITKNYATGAVNEMENLAYLGIKISYMLLFFISLPLMLNINFVLGLWLKEVPDYSTLFVNLIMVDSLVGNFFGVPLMTSLAATGKIRNYQIVVSLIIMLIVPVGYVALKMGYDAPSVFYICIVFTLLSGIARFFFCRKQIGFSFRKFMTQALLPIIYMTFATLPIPLILKFKYMQDDNWINFFILCFISIIETGVIAWFVGLKHNERMKLVQIVKMKIRRK